MPQATASTTFMQDEVPRRRGLKPGQPNPGGFKKGDDPRRPQGLVLENGETFAAKCRELGKDVPQFLHDLYKNENAPLPIRIRASEVLLDRGYGKAVNTLDVNVNRPLITLTREELTLIASQSSQLIKQDDEDTEDNVIEAVFTTVDTTDGET